MRWTVDETRRLRSKPLLGHFECYGDISPIDKTIRRLLRVLRPEASILVGVQQMRQYQTGDDHNKRTDGEKDAKITPEMAKRDGKDQTSRNSYPV